MWAIPTGTSSDFKKKKSGKESQYMVSHPELGSDPPIGSDRESGFDKVNNRTLLESLAKRQRELTESNAKILDWAMKTVQTRRKRHCHK